MLSVSTWSKADDEVMDTVRLRSGPGVGGMEPGTPEVVSAEVEDIGIVKEVERSPSTRLATSCNCKSDSYERLMRKTLSCNVK